MIFIGESFRSMRRVKFPNGDCYVGGIQDFRTEEKIQAIITSPPYFAKRLYAGVPDTWWGGEATCQHRPW